MAAAIEIEGLTKQYNRLKAVDNISLTVEEGAVFGFIGPNGAGKTTTMRILTTLLQPTSGRARVAGCDVMKDPRSVRRYVGYMPDFFGVYDDLKVWEYLDFFAACYNVPAAKRTSLVADLLALIDLEHRRDDFVESLSRGMKQRLCLARALAHDPQILILDEPAAGLDPRARVEIRELLRELHNMGKTIFLSSHILLEVAEICTEIGIIEAGKMVASGNLAEMQARLRQHRTIKMRLLGDSVEKARSVLEQTMGVQNIGDESPPKGADWHLQVDFAGDEAAVSALLARLVESGVPVISFWEEGGDLEDLFMQLTEGIVS
jgi:ABC-2 type transport system ATP-binding protein